MRAGAAWQGLELDHTNKGSGRLEGVAKISRRSAKIPVGSEKGFLQKGRRGCACDRIDFRDDLRSPAKVDCAAFAGIGRSGRVIGWAAARKVADWFDGACAAAHECRDEAEVQSEESRETHALSGKA